jgi:hypothetical protein
MDSLKLLTVFADQKEELQNKYMTQFCTEIRRETIVSGQ